MRLIPSLLLGLVVFAIAQPLSADVLLNPSFELGSGSDSYSGLGNFPSYPVTDWPGWNNTGVSTTLDVQPTTLPLPDAGSQMLQIDSSGSDNGIYQIFSHGGYYAGAWFYVLTGSAYLWLVDGSNPTQIYTTVQNQWEFVQFNSPVPSGELAIYTGSGGGIFDVDLVTVDFTPIVPEQLPSMAPEPASATVALLGVAGLFLAARRRRAG